MRVVVCLALFAACGFAPIDAPIDAPPPATCLMASWCKRKSITIDGTKVIGGPHVDFPVLVSLATDSDLANDARSDGRDILFTDADGVTVLAYERETFVHASGHLVAWVKVPNLSSNSVLYMYWGNDAAAEQAHPTTTWSSYAGVWHLDETSSTTQHDSTAQANGAIDEQGLSIGDPGWIETAPTFDGQNDLLRIPRSATLDMLATAGTISAWAKWTDASDGHFQHLMASSNAYQSLPNGLSLSTQADGDLYFYPWVGAEDYVLVHQPLTDATWQQITVTLDHATTTMKLYRDGAPLTLVEIHGDLWTTIASPADMLWGGTPDDPTGFFAGQIDEIHLSKVVRSVGWIATEAMNQKLQTTFVTRGMTEQLH